MQLFPPRPEGLAQCDYCLGWASRCPHRFSLSRVVTIVCSATVLHKHFSFFTQVHRFTMKYRFRACVLSWVRFWYRLRYTASFVTSFVQGRISPAPAGRLAPTRGPPLFGQTSPFGRLTTRNVEPAYT